MTVIEDREAAVVGQRLLRREDPALLTGEAKFTNDLNVPGALHLAVLRSAGLVQSRREGSTVYYRLADVRVLEAYRLIQTIAG